MDITVRNNTEAGSYDAVIDGQVVGMLVYERRGHRMIFRYTLVDEQHRRQGVGTAVTRAALDDAVAHGHSVTNYCGFVADFIAANPGYAAVLDKELPGMVHR